MNTDFIYDSPISNWISNAIDIVLLNLLFIICCIPIFTIGASKVALYRGIEAMRQGEMHIYRRFFLAFRQSFAQSLCASSIDFLTTALLIFDFILVLDWESPLKTVFLAGLMIMIVVWRLMMTYVYPQVAFYSNRLLQIYKNSLILSGRFILFSVIMTVLDLLAFICLLMPPATLVYTAVIWVFGGFSIVTYLNGIVLKRFIFSKYDLSLVENEGAKQ